MGGFLGEDSMGDSLENTPWELFIREDSLGRFPWGGLIGENFLEEDYIVKIPLGGFLGRIS